MAKEYVPQALHAELFDAGAVDGWVLPEVRDALRGWQEAGDPRLIDVEALPAARVEAPGIVSFALLTEDVCDRLFAEAAHYREESGLPQLAPNSMNRDGVILNDIGMRPAFTVLLRRYLRGIGARLFGDDADRAGTLNGVDLGTENWGGSTLSQHHTFVARYEPKRDRSLDMHVDDCDVTFNIGLTGGDEFRGGDLVFCGMFGDASYRRHHHTYRHELGRCIVHAGKRRHSVRDVEGGERASLVMWTKSLLFRETPEYRQKCGDLVAGRRALPDETGPPDPVCLSLSHDRDFLRWSHLL